MRIAGRRDEAHAQPTLAASLSPRDAVGRWFGADPTLWARYPSDRTPVHRVRLRLSFERPDGASRTVVISPVFPALSWAPEAALAEAPPARWGLGNAVGPRRSRPGADARATGATPTRQA